MPYDIATRLLLLVRRGWLLHPKYVRAYPLQHLPKLCAAPLCFAPMFPYTFATLTAPPLGLGSRVANVRDKGPPAGSGRLAPPFCAAAL